MKNLTFQDYCVLLIKALENPVARKNDMLYISLLNQNKEGKDLLFKLNKAEVTILKEFIHSLYAFCNPQFTSQNIKILGDVNLDKTLRIAFELLQESISELLFLSLDEEFKGRYELKNFIRMFDTQINNEYLDESQYLATAKKKAIVMIDQYLMQGEF